MKRILIVFLALAASAAVWAGEEGLSGRDIVSRGKTVSLSGTLLEEADEWYLKTPGVTYAIHLGNYEIIYPKGVDFKTGAAAQIRGFLYEEDISLISVKTGGKEYNFRKEDGTPLWSGQGRGRNAATETR